MVAIGTALALLLGLIVVLLANSDLGGGGTPTPTVSVPTVVGQPFDQASAALAGLGLVVQRVDDEGLGQAINVVLKQSLEEGRKAKKGSTIVLTVSGDSLTVPNVVGKQRNEAAALLIGPRHHAGVHRRRIRPTARHGVGPGPAG